MADYTTQANEFIDDLVAQGYDKKDIRSHFVAKGKQVIYPVIGEDKKPHLVVKTFK